MIKKQRNKHQESIDREVASELQQFMRNHSAKRFSKNLRKMLIEFLISDGATEAIYLQELLWDMESLFALLDAIEIAQENV